MNRQLVQRGFGKILESCIWCYEQLTNCGASVFPAPPPAQRLQEGPVEGRPRTLGPPGGGAEGCGMRRRGEHQQDGSGPSWLSSILKDLNHNIRHSVVFSFTDDQWMHPKPIGAEDAPLLVQSPGRARPPRRECQPWPPRER